MNGDHPYIGDAGLGVVEVYDGEQDVLGHRRHVHRRLGVPLPARTGPHRRPTRLTVLPHIHCHHNPNKNNMHMLEQPLSQKPYYLVAKEWVRIFALTFSPKGTLFEFCMSFWP